MSSSSYGPGSRRPVFVGKRRIPDLYVRLRADGREVFEARPRVHGKQHRYTLQARTKTEAAAELYALKVDLERGTFSQSPALRMTVGEVAVEWLAHLESRVGHRDPRLRRSSRTVELYRQRLADHILPELGTRPVSELTVADVRRMIDRVGTKRLAPATLTGCVTISSGLLRFAMKNGYVDRNPVRDLDRDDRPGTGRIKQPRYLTLAELERLLAALSPDFRVIALVCAFAGLRISETLGLRWRDLDLKAGTLTVEAQLGARGQRVPLKSQASAATRDLLPILARELRAHRSRQATVDLRRVRPDSLVFPTRTGRPQSRRNALRQVYLAGDRAGLNGDGRKPPSTST